MPEALDALRFPECRSCINREYDPFECKTCKDGSNQETQEVVNQENDLVEELSISEFIDVMKGEHGW